MSAVFLIPSAAACAPASAAAAASGRSERAPGLRSSGHVFSPKPAERRGRLLYVNVILEGARGSSAEAANAARRAARERRTSDSAAHPVHNHAPRARDGCRSRPAVGTQSSRAAGACVGKSLITLESANFDAFLTNSTRREPAARADARLSRRFPQCYPQILWTALSARGARSRRGASARRRAQTVGHLQPELALGRLGDRRVERPKIALARRSRATRCRR